MDWGSKVRLQCAVFPPLSLPSFLSLFQIVILSVATPHQRGLIILSISTWGNTKIQQRESKGDEREREGNREMSVFGC